MITKWLPTIETCQILGISQSTLRRRIEKDEVESKVEDGRRLILVTTDSQMVTTEEIDSFAEEKADLEQEVQDLQGKLRKAEEAATSADTKVDQLAEEKAAVEKELRGVEKQAALVDGLIADKEQLQQQLTEKDKQLESLQIQLQEASQRHDTVVMQMSKMLEYERQPFWRRWFKQKALPARGDVMDMEPGTAEETTPEEH